MGLDYKSDPQVADFAAKTKRPVSLDLIHDYVGYRLACFRPAFAWSNSMPARTPEGRAGKSALSAGSSRAHCP